MRSVIFLVATSTQPFRSACGLVSAFQALSYCLTLRTQVIGAVIGGGIIYVIASGKAGFALTGSNPLATNGYGAHSPGGYSLMACAVTEVVLTFMFLMIILGSTDRRAPQGLAPIPIGLALTLIHLISIPVTNTSVNPVEKPFSLSPFSPHPT